MGVINYISLAINGNSNPWDYLGIGNVLDADDSGLKVLTGLAEALRKSGRLVFAVYCYRNSRHYRHYYVHRTETYVY